jgi:hypothetical protein
MFCERLGLLLARPVTELRDAQEARQAVEDGLVDPVRAKVKYEPHAPEKVAAGRYRLYWAVSIVDQMIERLVCSDVNNTEIDEWTMVPSKPGIGFTDDMAREMALTLGDKSWASSDVRAWDWQGRVWLWELVTEIRCGQRDHEYLWPVRERYPLTNQVLWWRHHLSMRPVFVLSDGTLWVRAEPGLQVTGRYTTGADNSKGRVALTELALYTLRYEVLTVPETWRTTTPLRLPQYIMPLRGVPEWFGEARKNGIVYATCEAQAMGDDALEHALHDETQQACMRLMYEQFGFPLKDYVIHERGDFLFCSHRFKPAVEGVYDGNWTCSLESWPKTVHNLLCKSAPPLDEVLAVTQEMRHNEELPAVRSFLVRYAFPYWRGVLHRRQLDSTVYDALETLWSCSGPRAPERCH